MGKKLKEEFTEKMFNEFSISEQQEKKIKLKIVESNLLKCRCPDFEKELKSYNLTLDDWENYLLTKNNP